jgi:flagellar biosynthesis GTPase FlhF
LTDGQNVPDDIQTVDARRLARMIIGLDPSDEWSAVRANPQAATLRTV